MFTSSSSFEAASYNGVKNLLLPSRMILPSNLNVKDLLEADFVVITESAIHDITERLQ